MNYDQLIYPNLNQQTGAGWCLKFVQDSFGAPRMYASATDAANATKLRITSRSMPNVAVPVWFDHWGTYQGRYANWGHVVVWIPGRGFLSSPVTGFGQLWLSSLEAVERTFNAKYRFWSLDINTLTVAEKVPDPTPPLPPVPTPSPSPELSLGEIMAFKSIGIGYRPNEKEDRLITVGLDFESGQRTEVIADKSYCDSWYGGLTEGGFKILTKGHYDNALKEFDAAVAEKRAHELALAKASAGA